MSLPQRGQMPGQSTTTSLTPVAMLTLICCILTGVIFIMLRRKRRKKNRTYPQYLPSPPKLLPTWLGKLGGHMLLVKQGKMQQQLEDWADEFGGSYELFLFGTRRIILDDPAECRRILAHRPGSFGRGPSSTNVDWAGRAVGMSPSLFTDDDAAWRRSRRLVAPAFSGHNVRTMVPAIVKIAERLCAKWSAAADGDGIVDAKDDLGRYTHDVIALVGFRHESKAVTATEANSCQTYVVLNKMLGNFMTLLMSPTLWIANAWMPFHPWVRRVAKEKAIVKTLVEDLCENERRHIALEKGQSDAASPTTEAKASEGMLLRKLVEAGDGGGGGRGSDGRLAMPDAEIVTQARSLFLVGQETTSLSLAWSMYFLAKRPDVVARCREEVTQHISSSDGMAKAYEDTTSLVYTAAVFKETMRVKSTVPVLTFWAKDDYTMLDGSVYPKGTAFGVLFRYMATREKHFTRAKEFIPERWIESEREEALLGKAPQGDAGGPRAVNHVADAFMPFGSGPRICPGYGMANLEGVIMLAALCVQFDISLAPGQADPPDDRFVLTAGPTELRLKLTKRQIT